MLFDDEPILIHDTLGQIYAFTCWRRAPSLDLGKREMFGEDRTYAKQILRSIANHLEHDPFNYRLYDVWQMVYQKPWTQPATLDDLIDDLAEAAHCGRLFAYLEYQWLHDMDSGPWGDSGRSDQNNREADTPRIQWSPSKQRLGPGKLAAGLTTLSRAVRTSPVMRVAHIGDLGGVLEEVVAEDGTVYRKYSSERLYNATAPDGTQWQTDSIEENIVPEISRLDNAIEGLRNAMGDEVARYAREIAEVSTHVSENPDRVVLGRWSEKGGYIEEARRNGGVWYETEPSFFSKLTDGLSEAEGRAKVWSVNEQFLQSQLESAVDRIDLHGETIKEVLINRPNSLTAMEIKYLENNASKYGYMRDGNSWVRVTKNDG